MFKLIFTSILWAFSFSLIGRFIVGSVDTYIAIFIRFLLGFVVLLPFTIASKVNIKEYLKVIAVGAIQVGVMYIFYFKSFLYLQVSEVALFTIFTPFYVYLLTRKPKDLIHGKFLFAISLAILGAGIIKYQSVSSEFLFGFLLVQGANFCFSLGQVLFKKYVKEEATLSHFSGFYLGAFIVVIPLMILNSNFDKLPSSNTQYLVLAWLGIMASGIGYYLWNKGAKEVTGIKLAVLNNLIVPIAILVDVFVWGGEFNLISFGLGGGLIILSLFIIKKAPDRTEA